MHGATKPLTLTKLTSSVDADPLMQKCHQSPFEIELERPVLLA
jgi:hypothetical protein